MEQSSITVSGVIDTFLVLLIGIGPKLALVPFLGITASLDPAMKRRVQRKMLITAATVAVALIVLGELLRTLLHFTIGSLSIAGGVILLVLAVWMVLGQGGGGHATAGKDPLELAQYPLAVPYLLNPVGIVGLVTISAEAESIAVLAVAVGILARRPAHRHRGVPLGQPGQRQARREPHAGHREGIRLPDRRDRRATDPRRPGLGRCDLRRTALSDAAERVLGASGEARVATRDG